MSVGYIVLCWVLALSPLLYVREAHSLIPMTVILIGILLFDIKNLRGRLARKGYVPCIGAALVGLLAGMYAFLTPQSPIPLGIELTIVASIAYIVSVYN